MRTTAILNLKGGVAKTVTTVNMAAILARDYKARVLLIDADCQCNCIRGTTVDGVNLIPGDDSLMDLDLSKVELGRVSMNVLAQMDGWRAFSTKWIVWKGFARKRPVA